MKFIKSGSHCRRCLDVGKGQFYCAGTGEAAAAGAAKFAERQIQEAGAEAPRVWALKYDGTREVEIVVKRDGEGFGFTAQAVTRPDVFGAYELVLGPGLR